MENSSIARASARRLVFLAGLVLLLTLSFAALRLVSSGEVGTGDKTLAMIAVSEREAIALEDTDGDGIPDWEEELWGTDPEKYDTDGDGVKDSREVRHAEAEMLASGSSTPVERRPFVDEDENNVTRAAGREWFGSLMVASSKGARPVSEVQREYIINNAAHKASKLAKPEIYRVPSDKIIVSTAVTLYSYFATMGEITETMYAQLPTTSEQGVQNLLMWVKQDDEQARQEMFDFVDYCRPYIERMEDVIVPDEMIRYHETFVNAYKNYLYGYISIANKKDDPMLGLIELQNYPNRALLVARAEEQFRALKAPYDLVADPLDV